MSDLDDLFTITCGKCGKTSRFVAWVISVPGYYPNRFRCPVCGYTFERRRKEPRKDWEPFVELVEVGK